MVEVEQDVEASSSFDPTFFDTLFEIEERHFWFRARDRIIVDLVHKLTANLPSGYRVLEVGCGTGNVLRHLEKECARGMVVGMDLFSEGLRLARRRVSSPLVQGDMREPPFGVQFEVIGLFDVLEHLRDDTRVLHDLHDMLKPGGALILTVPAHPSLWSYFDTASRHVRRYRPAELRHKLQSTGYRVEFLTQYMATLFPIMWLRRRLAGLDARGSTGNVGHARNLAANELRIIPGVNEVMDLVLTQEARLIARRRSLPIGTSLLVLARKKGR